MHPKLVTALTRLVAIFFSVFAGGAATVVSIWPPAPRAPTLWEGYEALCVALLLAMFSFQIALGIVVRTAPLGKLVLVLRRFHTDPIAQQASLFERKPLRLAPLFENLGITGHRAVLLRDSRLIGDVHMVVYFAPLILLANFLNPVVLTYFGALAGLAYALRHWGAEPIVESWAAIAFLSATALLLLVKPTRRWFLANSSRHMQRAKSWFIRGRAPRTSAQLVALLRRPRASLTAIRTNDRNWREFARICIEKADVICFDLRSPSENCDAEIEMIRQAGRGNRVIWMTPDDDVIVGPVPTPGGYAVRAATFPGKPTILPLPVYMKSGLFTEDSAFLQRTTTLLRLIDAKCASAAVTH